MAVTGTQTSMGREGADKPSHGAGTFFPAEQACILLQFHCINADTTWSLDFCTHTAPPHPHLSERGQKRANRESGPSPSPASEATPTSYPWRPRGSRSPPPPATTRALPTGVSPGVNRGPWTSAGSNEAARLPCDVQTNRLNQQAQRGPRRTTERATVHISTENHSSSPKPGRSQMGEGQPVAGNAQGTGMSVLNLSLKWQNQKCLDT